MKTLIRKLTAAGAVAFLLAAGRTPAKADASTGTWTPPSGSTDTIPSTGTVTPSTGAWTPPTGSTQAVPGASVGFEFPVPPGVYSGRRGIMVATFRDRDGILLAPQLTAPGRLEVQSTILPDVLCGMDRCKDVAIWQWDTTSVANGTHTLVASITDETGRRYEARHTAYVLNGSSPTLVTSTGGVVGSTGTLGASVLITSGAVATPQTVLVQPAPLSPAQAGGAASQDLAPAGASADFIVEGQEDGMVFDEPVLVSLTYDPAVGDPEELTICWWDESNAKWEKLEQVTVDPENGVVSGLVDHFTFFAVMRRAAPPPVAAAFGEVYSYPNPAQAGKALTWRIEVRRAEIFRISLFTLDGRSAGSRTVDASLTSGAGGMSFQDVRIDAGNLAPGTYSAVIEAVEGNDVIRTTRRFSLKP